MKIILPENAFKCCHGCVDRRPGCHSRCDLYKDARKAWDNIRDRMRKEDRKVLGGYNPRKQKGGFST